MTIYIITAGQYSDYHIIAATVDKERAEKICELHKGNYTQPEIEKFEDSVEETYPVWRITFDRNGDVISINRGCDEPFDYVMDGENEGEIKVYVRTPEIEGAIKIAAEKRAFYVAKREGIA